MRRKFFVEVECNLDLTSPYDYGDVKEALAEKFSHETEARCTGFYVVPFAWDFKETTNPDDIVNEITCELTFHATELGASEHDVLFWHRHGDDGDNDVGYEIRWMSNPQVLFDIYVKKDKGIWSVHLDRNGKRRDLRIACVDDLIDYYKLGVSN